MRVELEKLKEWSDKSEGRLTCIFCYGPSSNDTRNRPRLVESPYCLAGSVQDWIGRWKMRFLWKEKL
ncbi:hypothetical protein KY290_027802 [Solanum tuberosum]|uniref:Uncharacterized protein n=1 Tax=Solanum tuberosum TaxID=4113 RepID=A0ABQ7UJC2_SOLTU|nr:hypothetical protein KY290_027802 [Solanum tuberosum]